MNNKKGFMNVSFGWIFALVVGAFILFMAIYVSVSLIDLQGTNQGAQVSRNLGMIFDPLETGFEDSKTTVLDISLKSKITNTCNLDSSFGTQGLKTSQKIFGKEHGGDIEVEFKNKYLFSDKIIEDRYFYIFSRKLDFPYKVADLVFVIPKSKTYCFSGAHKRITNLTMALNLDNIVNVSGECPDNADEKVCFPNSPASDCTIVVDNAVTQTTRKLGKTVTFGDDSTMLASIFSDPEIYECQMKRIMARVASLAYIYDQKKDYIESKNCITPISLDNLYSQAINYEDSSDLPLLYSTRNNLIDNSKFRDCLLW